MHERFGHMLPAQIFVDRPRTRPGAPLHPTDAEQIERALAGHHAEIAAVILEPIVQGAGGMWFYAPEYLSHVAALCRRYNVLLVLDEIATGFGRTGRMFACEHAGVIPDIMCLGKAMTGGYLSLAATLTSAKIADGISADGGVLMHGPTFMANPLACAVARQSIELLQSGTWQTQVAAIESQLRDELGQYDGHRAVADVRTLGAIGVVETHEAVPIAALQEIFVEEGVWIRPFNNLIYVMPAYVIDCDDLHRLTTAIGLALDTL